MIASERRALLDGLFQKPEAVTQSFFKMEGRVYLELVGPDGVVKQRASGKNAAVTFGMSRLADFIATFTGSASTWMNTLVIGTGATAPTSTDASLVASTGSAVSASKSVQGARTARYTAQFASSDNSNYTASIQEIGLFATNNNTTSLGARATFSPIVVKGSSDTLNCTYDIILQGT